MQRHVSDGEIGRLAAFDELHGMLTMVVSAFAGAAVISRSGLAAGPLAGAMLGLSGVTAIALIASCGSREPPIC
jgi:hypothetical protein